VLGAKAVAKPKFDFKGTTNDQEKFLATADVLENTGVHAYLGQVGNIKTPAILAGAGRMRWRTFLVWNALGGAAWAATAAGAGFLVGTAAAAALAALVVGCTVVLGSNPVTAAVVGGATAATGQPVRHTPLKYTAVVLDAVVKLPGAARLLVRSQRVAAPANERLFGTAVCNPLTDVSLASVAELALIGPPAAMLGALSETLPVPASTVDGMSSAALLMLMEPPPAFVLASMSGTVFVAAMSPLVLFVALSALKALAAPSSVVPPAEAVIRLGATIFPLIVCEIGPLAVSATDPVAARSPPR
jgi:hypothetical protein